MPVFADSGLPAFELLAREGITVRPDSEAPADTLRIGVLNLMPLKIPTEADILRAFSASDEDINISFFTTASHVSRNTPAEHIDRFYAFLDEDRISGLDGIVITGAPVEKIDYENVDYYGEFCDILDCANRLSKPALLLCWAAFAGFYRRYGVDRTLLTAKISGVYAHDVMLPGHPMARGLGASVYAPQSRFVTIAPERFDPNDKPDIIAASPLTGIHIASTPDRMETFVTGHGEYATETLLNEYVRDTNRGLNPSVPANYFVGDDPQGEIINRWHTAGCRVFSNWISSVAARRKPARERRPQAEEPQD